MSGAPRVQSPPLVETPRLVLSGHQKHDIDAVAALWADPEIVRFIGGTPSTRQESWHRLLRNRGLWPILGYGYWVIRERDTGRFVGEVGFADFKRASIPPIGDIPEAGWVLATWAHGRGYASEAVAAALAWLDRQAQLPDVVCLIDRANAASLRIAGKNGFLFAGEIEVAGALLPLFSRARPLKSSSQAL
jgi:RimJ/RimL family protein N-acetyltransferase